jgi:DNA topoisomerase-1
MPSTATKQKPASVVPPASGGTRWIRRLGGKASGFRYVDDRGRPVGDARTLARIERLRVPPAWREVHLARNPAASIQAWGIDARGRRQYRYHERAVASGEMRKYYRVRELARELPRIRRQVDADAARREPTRDAVAATVVRLIGEAFFRPGSERYTKENRTFGITTLRKSHVVVDHDCIFFRYVGKGSIRQRQCVPNRALARLVKRQLATPGPRLFRYRDGNGWTDLSARDVNEYLRDRVGVRYSAKDFRTWGGTLRAATVLAELGPASSPAQARRNVATAMRLVAAELGNTPTICRKSYVHPIVVAEYLDEGRTIELGPRTRRAADGIAHSPEERGLIRFLDEHFPERRHKRRSLKRAEPGTRPARRAPRR